MPSKSASMNQMPMQTKIGDASLKFGPDWLRALSSDNSTGGTGGSGSSGPSGGGWASGSGGGGGSGERASIERSPSGSYQASVRGDRDRDKESDRGHRGYSNHNSNSSTNANHHGGGSSAPPLLPPNRFKLSEFRYTREEILTLYDKNLTAPDYLTKFGTLFLEKMQPPLAFSQPSEEELRTWHVPQPESSRPVGSGPLGGSLSSPLSRGGGFAPRGRGVERGGRGGGRGGRGGYYARPHEEEDPRFRQHPFSRSLSAHERNWVPDRERNGLAGSPPEAESGRGGGGSWRSRNSDSYSKSGGRFEESDDGWRSKPRWRREDDQDEYTPPRSSTRRVHKSWSDDGTQDLPEWAKDNPSEESGTFDSSGAFHDEDRYSAKTNAFELSRRSEGGDTGRGAGREKDDSAHSTGSQSDRVQKRAERESLQGSSNAIKEQDEPEDTPPSRSKPIKSKPPSASPPPQPHKEVKDPPKENHRPQKDVKAQDPAPSQSQKPINEEHYRSLSEDADSLVAKLIEDDAAMIRQAREPSLPPPVSSLPAALGPVAGTASTLPAIQQLSTPPPPPPVLGSPDVWFYRDPQGNVQGPFMSLEMSLWLSQGYFTGGLYLRRECDKIFITLSEMGKLYGRNPFLPQPDSITPPPLMDGNGTSALDPLMVEPIHPGHPQFHQKQMFQQQQQYLLNTLQGQSRKEVDGWSQAAGGNPTANSTAAAQMQQAQILLSNMVKAGGGMGMGGAEGSPFDLQALFQRHTQLKGQDKGEYRNPSGQSQIPNQQNEGMVVDPIQSLLHQLTSMTNSQGQGVAMKTGSGNGWGPAPAPPNSWGSQIPPSVPTTSTGNPLWDYQSQYLKLQQMKAEEELLARKKKEEELERKRLQEEEEARKRIEAEQKRLEIEQEQKRAYEELIQQQQLAAAELARQRDELALQQRLQQQELNRQRMEQERALEKQREAIQKMEQQRLEQQRLEQQRMEQQRLEKEREEERERERERERLEAERRVQMELEEQKRREERRAQHDLQMKKLQELQLQQQQQQKAAPWSTGSGSQAARTLLEIQEEETIQLENRRAQQAALKKKQDEEAREQRQREVQAKSSGMSLTWAQQPLLPPLTMPIKTLAEIQAEEAAKLEDKRREKELQNRQHSLQQSWSSTLTWANRASLNAPPAPAQKGNGGGAWEDGRKKWEESQPAVGPPSKAPPHSSYGGKGVVGKEEDSFLKLIQDHGLSVGDGSGRKEASEGATEDPFTTWCYETVQQFAGTVDIPTFINFLKEVESPFEVNDYVRSYLGDGKEVREFGRQFLEKRSRWKSARSGAGKEKEDNLYRPAATANPPTAEFQEVKGKKGKKGKMQKVDARILGFNTTAAPDRLNVGKRDYGDGSDN